MYLCVLAHALCPTNARNDVRLWCENNKQRTSVYLIYYFNTNRQSTIKQIPVLDLYVSFQKGKVLFEFIKSALIRTNKLCRLLEESVIKKRELSLPLTFTHCEATKKPQGSISCSTTLL